MRQTCLNMVHELARADQRIFFVGSDLGFGTLKQFRDEMPERFLMEGISEAHVVGMAAGLALEGKIVYVNTIATFLTRRAFEQVCLDLCLHDANVRLIGNGGGLVYAPLGPTHLDTEDMAVMRALPRMTILAPADATEMRRLMPETVNHQGPIYIRLGKGHTDPVVTPADQVFKIGQGYRLRQGADAAILSTGVCLKLALAAHDRLAGLGIAAAVVHLPTVKPLDAALILETVAPTRAVVSVEEGTIIGGLGGAVAELLAEADFDRPKRFRRIGLPDAFPEFYGSQEEQMRRYGLSAENITAVVKGLLGA